MTWPEDRVSSEEVREWILSQTPGCEGVDGPTVVYRVNAWSLTARFAVKRPAPKPDTTCTIRESSVVCKIAFSSEDATAPLVYRVLQACGAGHVPELRAWQTRGTQTWLLFT